MSLVVPAKHSAPVAIEEDMVVVVARVCGVLSDGVVDSWWACSRLWGIETNWCWRESRMKEGREGSNALDGTVSQVRMRKLTGDASPCERVHGD